MKHLFSLAILLVCTLQFAFSQTEQGTFSLGFRTFSPVLAEANLLAPTNGVGISFGNNKSEVDGTDSDEVSYFSFGLNTSAQYFVIDNLSVGVNGNVLTQRVKEKEGEEDTSSIFIWMGGVEARYFIPVTDKTRVFLRAGGGIGRSQFSFNGEKDDNPTKLSTFSGGAGLAFFCNAHFAVEAGVGYGRFVAVNTYTFIEEIEEKDITGGLTLDLGFSYFFGGPAAE